MDIVSREKGIVGLVVGGVVAVEGDVWEVGGDGFGGFEGTGVDGFEL